MTETIPRNEPIGDCALFVFQKIITERKKYCRSVNPVIQQSFVNIKFFVLLAFNLFPAVSMHAQPNIYSPANLHSHNDYDRSDPFYKAFDAGFGSIEADIFLQNGKLLVAHEITELENRRNLESMYLKPIQKVIRKNGSYLSAGHKRTLILLIDIKSAARPALDTLVQVLKKYPELTESPVLKITISGNRPPLQEWNLFPPFIYFDGIAGRPYPDSLLNRLALFSDNFKSYSSWTGVGSIDEKEKQKLLSAIEYAHKLNKMVRFWNAPDSENAWAEFIKLGTDLMNTDHTEEAAAYFRKLK